MKEKRMMFSINIGINKPSASGKEVLDALGQVAHKVGLRAETVKSYVEKKVAETMQDQLKVISVNTANSTSSEFERWKNAAYTAGVVVDDSSFKVLVYGEVKNNSKFDVPVGVSMSGELYRITKLENSLLGGLVSGLASLAGVSPETRELITALNVHGFTIPILPAGKTYPYAILVDFGGTQLEGATKRGGVNIGDLIKTSSDVQLANVNVHAAFNTEKVSEEQIKKQNEWLLLAQNGLPEANFKDFFRNESLNQNEWDRQWSEILASTPSPSSNSNTSKPQEELESCTLHLFFDDGDDCVGEIGVKENGFWSSWSDYFKSNDEGIYTIYWPKEKYIDEFVITVLMNFLVHDSYTLKPIRLKNGGYYEINVNQWDKDR